MKKTDLILATIIGFIDGIFFLFILKNAEVKIPYSWVLPVAIAILCLAGMKFAYWIGERIAILLQAAKFFLVGTLNTFIDLGVLKILTLATEIKEGSNIITFFKSISFLVATFNSYFWNKYWTFEKKEHGSTRKEFIKFLIIATIGLLVNTAAFHVAFRMIKPQFGLGLDNWQTISAIIAAFFAFVWNFLASKFIVFKK